MVPNDLVVEKLLLAMQALLLGNSELCLYLSLDLCFLIIILLERYSYDSKIVLPATSIILLALNSDCGANLPAVFLSKGCKSVFDRLAVIDQQSSWITTILNHNVAREITLPFEIQD
jgi:hypothetical protein